jgi:hypothetical protein
MLEMSADRDKTVCRNLTAPCARAVGGTSGPGEPGARPGLAGLAGLAAPVGLRSEQPSGSGLSENDGRGVWFAPLCGPHTATERADRGGTWEAPGDDAVTVSEAWRMRLGSRGSFDGFRRLAVELGAARMQSALESRMDAHARARDGGGRDE